MGKRLPRLPRPSRRGLLAVGFGLAVASAAAAALVSMPASADRPVLYALYPVAIAAVFAVPAYLVAWLARPLRSGLIVAVGASACVLPFSVLAVASGFASGGMIWMAACFGAAGGLGTVAALSVMEKGEAARRIRIASAAGVLLVVAFVGAWLVAWRIPTSEHDLLPATSWESAAPAECPMMARAIRAMSYDRLPSHPPLIGRSSTGGPCDWAALGLPLQRLTLEAFQTSAGDHLSGRYIEHIGVLRPSYSMLHLRAAVEVSHRFGGLGGDGFLCTFHRSLDGWTLEACARAWIS